VYLNNSDAAASNGWVGSSYMFIVCVILNKSIEAFVISNIFVGIKLSTLFSHSIKVCVVKNLFNSGIAEV
jgi:hypothetical protein